MGAGQTGSEGALLWSAGPGCFERGGFPVASPRPFSGLDATDALARTLVHLARRTGDRARDLPPEDMDLLSEWLQQTSQAERYRELLTDPEATLFSQEEAWIFGEGLPAGLIVSDSGI